MTPQVAAIFRNRIVESGDRLKKAPDFVEDHFQFNLHRFEL
jgi:hypothetical protein